MDLKTIAIQSITNFFNIKMTTNIRALACCLQTPSAVKKQLPLRTDLAESVIKWRHEIVNILAGNDPRLLVIIGPCSVHDPVAVKDYARKLSHLQIKCPHLFFVMRTYFEKPRTRKGWSGFLHDPTLDGSNNMQLGVQLTRKLLIDLIGMGVPCATETLSLIAPQYMDDLLAFACIGARTTESQPHRELASGLSVPVGFKNSTSGSVSAAINAIHSATESKSFMGITDDGRVAVVQTSGNPDCCIVLRGGTLPNYKREDVQKCVEQLDIENMSTGIIVDASHGNSGKMWEQQMVVIDYLTKARHPAVRGIMVESFIRDGNQSITTKPLQYGVSVTDSCIGWDHTTTLMLQLNKSFK